jgi:mevalonate kinase
MNANQSQLARLGLSCAEIEELNRAALESGAAGAKLTGAGGGGAVVAVDPGDGQAVLDAWRTLGYKSMRVDVHDPQENPA